MTNDMIDPAPSRETAQPIAALDFEASSLPGPGSYPIEVGIAFAADGATRSWLIRPELGWAAVGIWDPAAERLHGLTRDTLKRDGQPVEEVTVELAAAVAGHAVVSDAATADGYWLQMLYAATGRKPPFRIAPLAPLLKDIIAATGDAAAGDIERAAALALQRFPERHRAGPDARRLAEIIRILTEAASPQR
jgi:hypothetical protein